MLSLLETPINMTLICEACRPCVILSEFWIKSWRQGHLHGWAVEHLPLTQDVILVQGSSPTLGYLWGTCFFLYVSASLCVSQEWMNEWMNEWPTRVNYSSFFTISLVLPLSVLWLLPRSRSPFPLMTLLWIPHDSFLHSHPGPSVRVLFKKNPLGVVTPLKTIWWLPFAFK